MNIGTHPKKPAFMRGADVLQGRRSRAPLALLVALLAVSVATPAGDRLSSARTEFQRLHPCPSTGKPRGACPGYVRDHIVPLACGGVDASSNLQWQTLADAKAKDRIERKGCEKPAGVRGM